MKWTDKGESKSNKYYTNYDITEMWVEYRVSESNKCYMNYELLKSG